jgi:hypothetical protein
VHEGLESMLFYLGKHQCKKMSQCGILYHRMQKDESMDAFSIKSNCEA